MLQPGHRIDHFHIIRRLGAGGMGEVYLAEDTKLQRYAALKILPPEYFQDTERKERFFREARVAAKISHPNVMAIYDMGASTDPASGNEINYLVMEYIEGQSLTEYMTRTNADLPAVVRLAEQIAAGLAAAHKTGVVHRDIKSENILIDANGNPKILDFGLAKPVAPMQMDKPHDSADTISRELTQAGKIVGTISYMSPEQIRGETVDQRSDIFSFGILLYRAASGSLPFEGESQVSTLAKILEAHPPALHSRNEKIPPELERIVGKCLQKSADDRYQDTRDLVVDLRNLRREYDSSVSGNVSAITDRPVESKTHVFQFSGKKLALITLALVIIVALVYQFMFRQGGVGDMTAQAAQNSLAILDFDNKTGSDELNWLKTGLPEILLTDLAQGRAMTIIGLDRVIDRLRLDRKTVEPAFSHSDGIDAAKKLGARHALSGSFYKLGNEIRIDARLEDITSGNILVTTKVVGSDPFSLVDSLTHKIAQSLNVEDKMLANKSVAIITSSSPEAYKKYLQAMSKFEEELYDDAIREFKEAIALDSTFALPYMRIGMAYAFQNRSQDGAQWFEKARRFEDRLPTWEKSLLDIYIDVWQKKNYSDAFVKMEMLVRENPQEKESRTIYGLLINAFTHDSLKVLAQLDTALQIDPQFLLALTVLSDLYAKAGNFEKSREYAQRASEQHPGSPSPYQLLTQIYYQQGKYAEAIKEQKALQARLPKEIGITLVNLYIMVRDFAQAREALEAIKRQYPDDPYHLGDYYLAMANLALWEGKFRAVTDYHHKYLDQLITTKDSNLIYGAYGALCTDFALIGQIDSSRFYSELDFKWATALQKPDAAISLVMYNKAAADKIRTIFNSALEEFKKKIPLSLWPLGEAITDIFEGYAVSDTGKIIAGFELVRKNNPNVSNGNYREMGKFYALTGKYQKAIEMLEHLVAGENNSPTASNYILAKYYLGIAYQGLGKTKEAKESFADMLKYWGNPDIEIREIKDARARMARLGA